jgi:hypothetical protein
MDKRLEEYFTKKYPNLFRDMRGDMTKTCMAWGCACGNGWFHIMNAAFKMAEHPGAVLLQVKEKLAGLRLYWMGPGPPDFPALSDEELNRISTAMDTAEDRSYQVCENCGAPGKMRSGGWLYTYCDRCHGFNKGSATYEIDADDKFMLGSIGDATGDKIARALNLRTTCDTEEDHQANYDYTHCVICKEILRVILPAVDCEEDKATVTDCPHDCDGKITPEKNVKYPKWACDTCGKRIGVVQVVMPPRPEPEKIIAMNCLNCEGELGEPDWTCSRCGFEVEVKQQPK